MINPGLQKQWQTISKATVIKANASHVGYGFATGKTASAIIEAVDSLK